MAQLEKEQGNLSVYHDKQAKATSAIAALEVELANTQEALVAKEASCQDATADKKLLEQECTAVKKDIEDVDMAIQKIEQEKTNRDHTIRSLNDEIANQDEVINKLNKESPVFGVEWMLRGQYFIFAQSFYPNIAAAKYLKAAWPRNIFSWLKTK